MRRVLAGLVLMTLLIGCGGSDDESSPTTEDESGPTTEGTATEQAPPDGGTTEPELESEDPEQPQASLGEPFTYRGIYLNSPAGANEWVVSATVTEVECGVQRIEDINGIFDPVIASVGQFCLVRGTAENTGNLPVGFDGGITSRVVDSQGREFNRAYQADSNLVNVNEENDIAPTQRGEWVMAFDVPADAELGTLLVQQAIDDPVVSVQLT